jgi:sirohydrochlorin cobaltochelatase
MDMVIVIAMHGMPPKDFPSSDLREFFLLHGQLQSAPGSLSDAPKRRYLQLHEKMRNWPRSPENDPFNAAATELALLIREELSCPVHVGFNEFCAPSLDEAITSAASRDPLRILIVTPMLTRGGEHAEIDIPDAIDRARKRYPNIHFVYCWPFDHRDVAHFLAGQIHRFFDSPAGKKSVAIKKGDTSSARKA